MSEKGQGEEATRGPASGTATATDVGSAIAGEAAGGGSQADQSGPDDAGTMALDPGGSVADDIEKAAEAFRATDGEVAGDEPPDWQGPEQEAAGPTLEDVKGAEDAKEAMGDEEVADAEPTPEDARLQKSGSKRATTKRCDAAMSSGPARKDRLSNRLTCRTGPRERTTNPLAATWATRRSRFYRECPAYIQRGRPRVRCRV